MGFLSSIFKKKETPDPLNRELLGSESDAAHALLAYHQHQIRKSSEEMSENEAQEIVYAFIDVIAEGSGLIDDEDRLKHPKPIIDQAFRIHIAGYDWMREASEETFIEKGYDKEVSDLESMWARLWGFKKIAPEDKAAIANLRFGIESDEVSRAIIKYSER